ncbi:hypothetical protein Poli38472_009689 [Pythium oligandrum]|uniref:Photolyase/cryptochrome alpha/beta domain-containing protein n=1 Tax=Pythium oligandrum TaxID=41045 RepID=A0A8K1CEY7_PYTOL|nr:hypothetical protein Poli38472_009689 [Pythium oligandrum]|eukprot:TMW62196.1 hypothetical protein Poli38472_009689 [Pythium oligandrum]
MTDISLDDEHFERIGAQIAALRQETEVNASEASARLYSTSNGGLVRVLDAVEAPLSPGMLQAINRYLNQEREEAEALNSTSEAETTTKPAEERDVPVEAEETQVSLLTLTATSYATQVKTTTSVEMEETQVSVHGVNGLLTLTASLPTSEATQNRRPDPVETEETQVSVHGVNGLLTLTASLPMSEATSVRRSDTQEAEPMEVDSGEVTESTPQLKEPVVVREEATMEELMTSGSSASNWLSGYTAPVPDNNEPASESSGVDTQDQSFYRVAAVESLLPDWPQLLLERTRICYSSRRAAYRQQNAPQATDQGCVVYWLRHTLRVSHGNFALDAAVKLAQQSSVPVVVTTLLPSSVWLPTRHAATADEAFARSSLIELRRHLRDRGIKFSAFALSQTHQLSGNGRSNGIIDGGAGLYELLSAFQPFAVVTDDGFTQSSRTELDTLRQYLSTRANTDWPLLAVDSMTCVPFYQRCPGAQKSLRAQENELFISEEAFTAEYAAAMSDMSATSMAKIERIDSLNRYDAEGDKQLIKAASKVGLEPLQWEILEATCATSRSPNAPFGEKTALTKLEALLRSTDTRPAVQQELQGAGVLSLLPFIRHGSLYAGHVIDRLASALASMPRPSDAQTRKGAAMLKVLRSRAFTHLAKERDYMLYLSLWAASHQEHVNQLSSRMVPFRALASFQPSSSDLDSFQTLLPSWVLSTNMDLQATRDPNAPAALYDPYQLESGRTDDPYWNDIQLFLHAHRYLHPLVILYWAYRLVQWSVSLRAAIMTIMTLLDKCSLGAPPASPDTVMVVWSALFRLVEGKTDIENDAFEALREFQQRTEAELVSQPKLQLRKQ